MASAVKKLCDRGLIRPPSFLVTNVQYETIMGSLAYGVSADASDMDIYGFCIPPKDMIFPHLAGEIDGFGRQKKRFGQWQQHHVQCDGTNYDLCIYSIVRFFSLCMENNPNMVDSLFTPLNCVLHATKVGQMVREKRKIFLHKGCWPKFKGYAFSQLHKMDTKTPQAGSNRYADVQKHGFDVKFAYHVVRLLDEVEQILTLGDLDLQRAREQLKSIRRGEWTIERIREHFASKEKLLESIYEKSSLPWGPDEPAIKRLLLQCLEEHYGSLAKCVVIPGAADEAIGRIMEICEETIKR